MAKRVYRAGYRDGSGKEYVTLGGTAIAVTNWGCSCCQPTTTDEHKRTAARIAKAMNLLDATERAERKARKAQRTLGFKLIAAGSLANLARDLEVGPRLAAQQKIGGR